ncbi:hypothetical protein BD324DRAFT_51547 [Kockovaella imperatae]|uniref:Nucleotide-diphospho-sugar transferase domain-containing protein n=1 Tax=Kockovaella imperatae TaxID=4999 RepID=A0A1Y1UT83_9TREE|nr:hypothetical protein BD324DRAFT_51547 [Kockovaella imperatae]ORX41233.1 hypothetical protein BD324DRAFT_51547 [Kockovaella imperatae]
MRWSAVRRPGIFLPPIITLVLCTLLVPTDRYTRQRIDELACDAATEASSLPKVHLFLPINKASAEKNDRFCKAMESAIVNGWEPIVYNWELNGDRSHMLKSKVYGFSRLLNSSAVTQHIAEDDLVLLIDALDVWLQLSPAVTASRFLGFDSEIVVGADKVCYPNPKNGPDCAAAPPSPLPEGLFFTEDDESKPRNFGHASSDRPIHANSGTVLGRFYKMKELYVKLMDLMASERYKDYRSDQGQLRSVCS